jgi:hypothetical protein
MAFDEFDVREIDAYGDAIRVDSMPTHDEAVEYLKPSYRLGDAVAVVIEHHRGRCCNNADCEAPGVTDDNYETIATAGDEAALREGGWIE